MTARAWGDMSPEEKVAWLRVWAVRNDYDATASDCKGRNATQKRHALTAAALAELADRIERDKRRREPTEAEIRVATWETARVIKHYVSCDPVKCPRGSGCVCRDAARAALTAAFATKGDAP